MAQAQFETSVGLSTVQALRALEADDRFRVLRRIEMPAQRVVLAPTSGTSIGICIDTETTGLDHDVDRIIELAVRRFKFDAAGRIVALDTSHHWLEDPGIPLDPTITRITGLTDADVAGKSIDEQAACDLLNSASLVVAHNSAFDRDFVEARLPKAAGLRWSCSMAELDWGALGYESRSLRWLLVQMGWFYQAHRAGDDVDALLELLRHDLTTGETVLSHVLDAAQRHGWLVRAEGAHYDRRQVLKHRGYRWNSSGRVWLREVADRLLDEERLWLEREVYSPTHRPRCAAPRFDRIDATKRYRTVH